MSRHRHVRNPYDDDFDDGLDDEHDYGESVDEDCPMSPSQREFVFRRERTESGSEVGPRLGLEAFLPSADPFPEESPADVAMDKLSLDPPPGLAFPKPTLKPLPGLAPSASSPNFAPMRPKLVVVDADRKDGGRRGFDSPSSQPPAVRLLAEKRQASPSPNRSATPTLKSNPPRYGGRNSMPTPKGPRVRKAAEGEKAVLNLVVIGHVDAGKSTLMGHLLFQLGQVNQRIMHKYKTESAKAGKGSFAFAWVLDESQEERDRGVTMDIARSSFETETKRVTLLDAPGHRDFIPNMISGTTQADAAVLVVNAGRGEFETGFQAGGQTREHALLARSLGVSELIVAVNKMDSLDWSEERYSEVVEGLRGFLKTAGYAKARFVPLSGLCGDNVTAPVAQDHPLAAWYQGPCLLQLIDSLPVSARSTSSETRVTVSDVYKGLTGGVTVTGKVESGSVEAGDRLLALPALELLSVRAVEGAERDGDGIVWAGSELSLTLWSPTLADSTLLPGAVLVAPEAPLRATTRFTANILCFGVSAPLTPGFPVVLHAHNAQETAAVSALVATLDKASGAVLRKKPRCIPRNSRAIVEIRTERPVCVEAYSSCRELGRITLRSAGQTLAAGIVVDVLD